MSSVALIGKLIGLGSAAAATTAAASLTWVALHQAPKATPKTASANDAGDVVLCAGDDAVLRRAGPQGCGAGRKIAIEPADTNFIDCDDCTGWGEPGSQNADRKNREPQQPVDALEERVARLHRSPLFTVVDKYDDPIFAVGPEQTKIYRANQLAARIDAADDGGVYNAMSNDGSLVASFGATTTHAGLSVSEAGTSQVDIGRQPAGNYALKIRPIGKGQAAGIGQSEEGTGAIVVGDALGAARASIAFDGDRPGLNLFSVAGSLVGTMRQAESGAGILILGNANGEAAVKMVVNANRYGVVIAGPRVGLPLVTGSGLPGSYILGCGGGPACIP